MKKIEIYEEIFGKSEDSVITIDSGKAGKTISIIACIHGNETCGLFVFHKLLN